MSTVNEIMNTAVLTVRADDTLSTAAATMLWSSTRHLPVLEGKKLVGILSERDLLRFRGDGEEDALNYEVRFAMKFPCKFTHPEASIGEAAAVMADGRIGCLPVVWEGDVVGIVTTTDILRSRARDTFAPHAPKASKAGDIMTTNLVTARTGDSVGDAVAKMAQRNVRHLPVVDGDNRFRGMISEDGLRMFAHRERHGLPETFAKDHVGTVMNEKVPTFGPDTPAQLLSTTLATMRLGAVPIVDKGEHLVGIVSYVDILNHMTKL